MSNRQRPSEFGVNDGRVYAAVVEHSPLLHSAPRHCDPWRTAHRDANRPAASGPRSGAGEGRIRRPPPPGGAAVKADLHCPYLPLRGLHAPVPEACAAGVVQHARAGVQDRQGARDGPGRHHGPRSDPRCARARRSRRCDRRLRGDGRVPGRAAVCPPERPRRHREAARGDPAPPARRPRPDAVPAHGGHLHVPQPRGLGHQRAPHRLPRGGADAVGRRAGGPQRLAPSQPEPDRGQPGDGLRQDRDGRQRRAHAVCHRPDLGDGAGGDEPGRVPARVASRSGRGRRRARRLHAPGERHRPGRGRLLPRPAAPARRTPPELAAPRLLVGRVAGHASRRATTTACHRALRAGGALQPGAAVRPRGPAPGRAPLRPCCRKPPERGSHADPRRGLHRQRLRQGQRRHHDPHGAAAPRPGRGGPPASTPTPRRGSTSPATWPCPPPASACPSTGR